jgi:hypothetical protein
MKKQLIMAIGLIIAVCSCKKESAPGKQNHVDPGQHVKSYAVGFNLSGFTKETKGISAGKLQTNAVLKDVIKYLSYYVYNGSKDSLKSVKSIKQQSTDSNFGVITDSLAAGHYTIFFVGSTSADYYITNSFVDVVQGTYHPALGYKNDTNFGDTFVQKLEVDVTAATTQNVVLKRAVSLITVKLLDVLPASINKVVVTIGNGVPNYDLVTGGAADNGTHGLGWSDRVQTFTVQNSDKGKSNVEFCTYVWPFSSYLNPQVSAYNSSNVAIGNKPLTEDAVVQVDVNTQYIYSGYLFQNAPSNFNITVDAQWNAPKTNPFYF